MNTTNLNHKTKNQLIEEIISLRNELSSKNKLNDIKDHFSILMQQSPSVIELYDLDGLQISVNKAYEELWDFPASTTVNKFNVLKSKEVVDTGLINYINRAYNGETVKVPEYSFNPKGETEAGGVGRIRWLATKIFPLKDTNGIVTSIVITHEDITDKKEAEEELKQSLKREKNQADIVRNSPTAIAFGYPDGRLENCNDAFCKLTGYSIMELQSIKWNDVLTPKKWIEIENKQLQKLTPDDNFVKYEKEYIHKNGNIIPIELSVTASFNINNNIIHFTGFINDISIRKQSENKLIANEDQLRLSKERFEIAVKGSNDAIWDWDDLNSDEYWWSDRLYEILGYKPSEVEATISNWKKWIHPDDKNEVSEILNNHLQNNTPYEVEFRMTNKFNEYKWIFVRGVSIRDENGVPQRMAGSITDITERKLNDIKIAHNEKRYRDLINTINSGVAIYKVLNNGENGSDYIFQEFNRASETIEGKSRKDVIGKSLFDLRPNIDEFGLIPIFKQVWETGEPAYFPAKQYIDEKYSNYYENRVFKLSGDEIVAVYDDVTEKENAFLELQKSKDRFDLAMNASQDGLYDWNLLTNGIYFSPGWKKMLGYNDDELPNDFSIWEKLTDPIDAKKSWAMLQELTEKKIDRFEIEFKMQHKDGHWVDILSRAEAVFDENNKAIRVLGTHVDISDLKKVKKEINLISKAIENSSTAFDMIDNNGKYIYVNQAFLSMWGFKNHDEVIGSTPAKLTLDPIIPSEIQEKLRDFGVYSKEVRAIKNDGTPMDVQINSFLFHENNNIVYCTSTIDITEKKLIDKELGASEERFRTLTNLAPAGIFLTNKDGICTYVNPRWLQMNEMKYEDALGDGWVSGIHPDDVDMVSSSWYESQENRKSWTKEFRFQTPNGKVTWVESHADPIFDNEKNLVGFIGINLDITERKISNQVLIESEAKFRSIFDSRLLGTFFWNADGDIIESNQAFLDMVGYTMDDINDKIVRWKDMTPAEYLEKDKLLLKELAETGIITPFEKEYYHKDGSRIPIIIGAATLPGHTTKGVAYVLDITHQKLAENEAEKLKSSLELAQKMANIGFWSFDIEAQIPTWSDQMYINLGCKKEDGPLPYLEHKRICHPDDWDTFNSAVQKCVNGTPYNLVVRFIFPNGTIHHINTQGFPRYDDNNNITELFGTSIDVTHLKEAEKELIEHKENLEEIVKQRTTELEIKNKELDNALKVFVGREITIRDLQRRLNALENDY